MNSPSECTRSDRDEPVRSSPSLHWTAGETWDAVEEKLAVEAPLAIEVSFERNAHPVRKLLAITMRTPGHDEELALGFLLAEGLVRGINDLIRFEKLAQNSRGENVDTVNVRLANAPREDLQRVSRGILTSAACGVCGRLSLDGLSVRRVAESPDLPRLACETLVELPDALRRFQSVFRETGGSHGAALAKPDGAIVLAREDVGRHNAVDKLVGAALRQNLRGSEHVLVLSGRASFELVQKASAAGFPLIVAVGAPSSLAVTLADSAGITLVGFTRQTRLNVYTHAWRLKAVDDPSTLAASQALST